MEGKPDDPSMPVPQSKPILSRPASDGHETGSTNSSISSSFRTSSFNPGFAAGLSPSSALLLCMASQGKSPGREVAHAQDQGRHHWGIRVTAATSDSPPHHAVDQVFPTLSLEKEVGVGEEGGVGEEEDKDNNEATNHSLFQASDKIKLPSTQQKSRSRPKQERTVTSSITKGTCASSATAATESAGTPGVIAASARRTSRRVKTSNNSSSSHSSISSSRPSRHAANVRRTKQQTGTGLGLNRDGQPLQRHNWSEAEDALLRAKVSEMGEKQWNEISEALPGRNPKQCYQRWHYALVPVEATRAWTPAEDIKIIHLFEENGTKWTKSATHLEGRSGYAVKNRFKRLQKEQAELRGRRMGGGAFDELLSSRAMDVMEEEKKNREDAKGARGAAVQGGGGGKKETQAVAGAERGNVRSTKEKRISKGSRDPTVTTAVTADEDMDVSPPISKRARNDHPLPPSPPSSLSNVSVSKERKKKNATPRQKATKQRNREYLEGEKGEKGVYYYHYQTQQQQQQEDQQPPLSSPARYCIHNTTGYPTIPPPPSPISSFYSPSSSLYPNCPSSSSSFSSSVSPTLSTHPSCYEQEEEEGGWEKNRMGGKGKGHVYVFGTPGQSKNIMYVSPLRLGGTQEGREGGGGRGGGEGEGGGDGEGMYCPPGGDREQQEWALHRPHCLLSPYTSLTSPASVHDQHHQQQPPQQQPQYTPCQTAGDFLSLPPVISSPPDARPPSYFKSPSPCRPYGNNQQQHHHHQHHQHHHLYHPHQQERDPLLPTNYRHHSNHYEEAPATELGSFPSLLSLSPPSLPPSLPPFLGSAYDSDSSSLSPLVQPLPAGPMFSMSL